MSEDKFVKFKSLSKETFDGIEEKDDRSLYFVEDTQEIYKGDTKYSDGRVSKENTLPVYELSETEFWESYSSGLISNGLYAYDHIIVEDTKLSDEIVICEQSCILETDDLCYIATYARGVGSTLCVVDSQCNLIGKYSLADMLLDVECTQDGVQFQMGYLDINRSCIGIDDSGYLYINARGIAHREDSYYAESYARGVITVNTNDISNPASWSILRDVENHLAFGPMNFTRITPSSSIHTKPKYFNTNDGGVFAYSINMYSNCYNRCPCDSYTDNSLGHSVAYYLKGGQVITSSNYHSGPMAWAVDPQNNRMFGLEQISSNYQGRYQICVKQMDISGNTKTYNIYRDGTLSHFDNIWAHCGSILHYANDKVFVHIPNHDRQWTMVLNLLTENYECTEVADDFYETDRQQYTSDVYDNGTSISFILYRRKYESGPYHRQLISWNYIDNKLNVTQLLETTDFAYVYDILRTTYDNSILIADPYSIKCIDPDSHSIVYEHDLDYLKFQILGELVNHNIILACSAGDNTTLVEVNAEGCNKSVVVPNTLSYHTISTSAVISDSLVLFDGLYPYYYVNPYTLSYIYSVRNNFSGIIRKLFNTYVRCASCWSAFGDGTTYEAMCISGYFTADSSIPFTSLVYNKSIIFSSDK